MEFDLTAQAVEQVRVRFTEVVQTSGVPWSGSPYPSLWEIELTTGPQPPVPLVARTVTVETKAGRAPAMPSKADVRLSDGSIYRGTNFENSSFPAGTCAERTAIGSAVSDKGKIQIMEMVIVTQSTPPGAPCGVCRQAISEFAEPTAMIHVANAAGDLQSFTLGELLPHAFTSSSLKS